MPHIDNEKCDHCRICMNTCGKEAIYEEQGDFQINLDICNNCGNCITLCPNGAVDSSNPAPEKKKEPISIPNVMLYIDNEKCFGDECGQCLDFCPVKAINRDSEGKYNINNDICNDCNICLSDCPIGAVYF